MARNIRLGLAVLMLACVTAQPAMAAKWTKLRSPNFLFVGDAPEGDIRQVARRLEQFRAVMATVLPNAVSSSPTPTVVIVFSSDRAFTPFKPHYQGKPIPNLGGFIRSGDDVNYIAMNAEAGDFSLRIIFHEYSHLLIGNTVGELPVWINEGLAEFYGMYQEQDGGKAALIGLSPAEHVERLRERQLMPIDELMAVDHSSPAYNESNRQGLFYAQSWALVHYLTLGNAARAPQLRQYLQRVQAGASSDEAFRAAFQTQPNVLEQELKAYVRQFTFKVQRLEFSGAIGPGALARGEAVAEPDAQAYLGDLLARLDPERGRAYLQSLAEKNPQNARAVMALGLLALREQRTEDALTLVQRAATLAPDDPALQGALGRVLVERLSQQSADRDSQTATLEAAKRALERAVELDPSAAGNVAMLGYVELVRDADLPRAVSLLERAARMAPAREDYVLLLAEALFDARQYERATALLGPLLLGGRRAEIRTNARTLLARVAEARADALASAANGPPVAATSTLDIPARPSAAAAPPSSSAPTAGPPTTGPPTTRQRTERPAVFIPDLRPVAAGETRVLGIFESIECNQDQVVLRVRTDRGPVHLAAKALSDIDFISYRPDPPKNVNCGAAEKPLRVLATYRPLEAGSPAGIDGHAVAIELIPDSYMPR